MIAILTSNAFLQMLVITGLAGCSCAWLTGRAIALTWRPAWHVVAATLVIAAAIRFFHFALFNDPLLAVRTSLAEIVVLLAIGLLAWRRTRALQMAEQYYWLYEAHGPFGWRRRQPS